MMMFGWLTHRAKRKEAAARLYEAAVAQARNPVFYKEFGVPDTMDGRFDLISLHVCLILARLGDMGKGGDRLGQALFDKMFKSMEFTLREIGVGDLGVPKHMQRMMKAFNGRAHAYRDAISARDDAGMRLALSRNVYRNGDNVPPQAGMLAAYAFGASTALSAISPEDLMQGRVTFPPPAPVMKEAA